MVSNCKVHYGLFYGLLYGLLFHDNAQWKNLCCRRKFRWQVENVSHVICSSSTDGYKMVKCSDVSLLVQKNKTSRVIVYVNFRVKKTEDAFILPYSNVNDARLTTLIKMQGRIQSYP